MLDWRDIVSIMEWDLLYSAPTNPRKVRISNSLLEKHDWDLVGAEKFSDSDQFNHSTLVIRE